MIATLILVFIAIVFTTYYANKDLKLYNEYKRSGEKINMFSNNTIVNLVIIIVITIGLIILFFTN